MNTTQSSRAIEVCDCQVPAYLVPNVKTCISLAGYWAVYMYSPASEWALDPKLAVCLTNHDTYHTNLAGDSCISSDNLRL